jgi:hypothetical protein
MDGKKIKFNFCSDILKYSDELFKHSLRDIGSKNVKERSDILLNVL